MQLYLPELADQIELITRPYATHLRVYKRDFPEIYAVLVSQKPEQNN